jgi:hypothetical protein
VCVDDGITSNIILVVNPPADRPPKPTFGPDKRRGEGGEDAEHPADAGAGRALAAPWPAGAGARAAGAVAVAGVNEAPLYSRRETIDLRNSRLCDDGAWALTVSIQVCAVVCCAVLCCAMLWCAILCCLWCTVLCALCYTMVC